MPTTPATAADKQSAIDPIVRWLCYVDSLPWVKGSLDDSGNRALLRAGSLGIPEQVAFDEILRRIENAGVKARINKLKRQLASAYARAGQKSGAVFGSSSRAKWPIPNLDAIRQIIGAGLGLYELIEASPIHWNDGGSHTEEIIDVLFPGDPLLCTALSRGNFATKHREQWRGQLAGRAYIVPNPMLAVEGLTQEGKKSQHTLEATGRRVYQVIEFDFGSDHPLMAEWTVAGLTVADVCAALHLNLANLMPLACVTSSGGKSLHGWYLVYSFSELVQRKFMSDAVRLGADRALWCRSQFSRIPDGLRENGEPQTCFYLDSQKAISL
jgi:hypothetical protein